KKSLTNPVLTIRAATPKAIAPNVITARERWRKIFRSASFPIVLRSIDCAGRCKYRPACQSRLNENLGRKAVAHAGGWRHGYADRRNRRRERYSDSKPPKAADEAQNDTF